MTKIQILALAVAGFFLTGCAWLPASGPTTSAVVNDAAKDGVRRYIVVNVNGAVVDTLLKQPVAVFQSKFGADHMPPSPTISVGDAIVVSIWEAGGGALFASSPIVSGVTDTGSRPVTIPEQLVLPDGSISVPFAGRVAVVGATPEQLQDRIRQSLNGKAIDPQVIVAVTRSPANTVTVTGEVVSGARVPLSPKGDRILDVIASAGGVKTPVYETSVRLTRNGITATIPFSTLLATPKENIYAWPGDILTVVQEPRYFVAFGATGRDAEIPFGEETLNLSQALGKSSGLLDDRADSTGVFLLRYEPRDLATALSAASVGNTGDFVPVVYRFNLKDLKTYFLAQRFSLENKDIIYVANSQSNSIQKFFQLLGTLTNPIVTGVVMNNSLQ